MPVAVSPKHAPPLPGELLAVLLGVVGEVNAVLDPEELLPTMARELRKIVDYTILDIFLPTGDGGLTVALVEGPPGDRERACKVGQGEGIVGEAAATRRAVFVPDVRADPRYIACFPDVVSELAIPLLHGGDVVGVLNIEGPDVGAFNALARTALQVLATHLATAISHAQLHREAERYANRLATLHDIGTETASILDPDRLLARVAEEVKRVIDYEMFGILLLDEGGEELVLRQSVRFGHATERTRVKVSEGLCGAAVRTKRPVRVGDVSQDPRYLPLIPETRSELVVPLVHKDRVVGVFDLESSVLDRFTEEDARVLVPLATQAAVAIENARLVERLRREDARLQKELAIARQVQRGLLPEENPNGPGWEASAHFRPARELGGDLYDFYDLRSGVVGVTVGDVTGKGVAAALYAAFASGTVRRRAFAGLGPAALLGRVNGTLRRRGVEGLYCTLGYAVFDLPARRVTLANSGLPYPLRYEARHQRCTPIEIGGLPLGAFDAAEYDETSFDFEPGDVVVFHSDGATEAMRAGGGEYGLERLASMVERHAASLSAAQLGDLLAEDIESFLAEEPRGDDLTLLVVKAL